MRSLVVAYSEMNGNGGGIFATLAYVNAMASIADETVFLFPSKDGNPDGRIHPAVRQVPVADPASRFGKVKRILFKGILHRFEDRFVEMLSQEHFDLITFHNSKASRGLVSLAHAHGAGVITVHNNYERDYTVDNERPFLLPLMLPATLRSERESVLGSDLNLVLCGKDRELLYRHYDPGHNTRIEVLGVFEFADRDFSVRKDVADPVFVITGNLSTRQAEESLLPWMKEYLPVLRQAIPEASVILAGKKPSARLKTLAAERSVEVIDTPADINAVMARGKYYLCPTCKGGGVKLRVMDGLRFGMPVLCHEVSGRGYEPFRDITLFAYHDRASFLNSLKQMLSAKTDPEAALDLYRAHFSFSAGKARLAELIESMDL